MIVVRVNRWSTSTGGNIWRPPWGMLKLGYEFFTSDMRSTRQGYVVASGVVPPGGDNVTTQQLMDTMCALQEQLARLELK